MTLPNDSLASHRRSELPHELFAGPLAIPKEGTF